MKSNEMERDLLLNQFFSKAKENLFNDYLIRRNVPFPSDAVIDYVRDMCNIQYEDYITYLLQNPKHVSYSTNDLTQSSKPENCHVELCRAFQKVGYKMLSSIELADLLYNDDLVRNNVAKSRYGRDQLSAAKQLGLTMNIGRKWSVTCIGRVFLDLDEKTRFSIMARALLRDPFYSKVLTQAINQEIFIEDWMQDLKDSTIRRRLSCIRYMCGIAVKEVAAGTFHKILFPTKR